MNNNYGSQKPELSVVIVIVSSVFHLKDCLGALSKQKKAPEMEIIVPYDGSNGNIDRLKLEFPKVQFYKLHNLYSKTDMGRPNHKDLDRMRSMGIMRAKGDVVALLEDHDRPDEIWSRQIVEEHNKHPYAAIGGAIENVIDRKLNWAIYFCDFGKYQNPVEDGPSSYLSDVNVSYKRKALTRIKDVWMDSYHEPEVHESLVNNGETLWLSHKIIVYQSRGDIRIEEAIKERYLWGRYYAGLRVQEFKFVKRLFYTMLSPLLPIILVAKKIRDILRKKRNIGAFIAAFPFTSLLLLIWCLGEFVGYLTARPS